jgi:hypothetical protein
MGMQVVRGSAMPDTTISHLPGPRAAGPDAAAAPTPRFSRPLAVVTAAVVLLLAGTLMLWVHYGTAVFYETILAGIAACL